jgi:hypothetical protein
MRHASDTEIVPEAWHPAIHAPLCFQTGGCLFFFLPDLAHKSNRPLAVHSITKTTNCRMANLIGISNANEANPSAMATPLAEIGKAAENIKKHVRMTRAIAITILGQILTIQYLVR